MGPASQAMGYAVAAEQFWRQGFLQIRNFFEEGEILHAERRLLSRLDAARPRRSNQWVNESEVEQMLFSEKVLKLARSILGATPVFWGRVGIDFREEVLDQHYPVGHEALMGILPSAKRFLHIDAKGTEKSLFAKRSGFQDARYPVIRFAHFFQDHSRYSYGIKIGPCSHVMGDPERVQQLLNPPLRRQDLLVFNLKTVHSARCLLHRTGRVLTPSEEDALEPARPQEFLPAPVTRNTLMWDFSSSAREAELFIRNRAVFEFREWHNYGSSLDSVPSLQKLSGEGQLSLRHDTEIAFLRMTKWSGGLSNALKARLCYLESNNPQINSFSQDAQRFHKEVRSILEGAG